MAASPEATLTNKRDQLRFLLDRQEIEDCIWLYCRGVDRHDDELIASVYFPDSIESRGVFVGSIPEFIDRVNGVHNASFNAHTHNITTRLVEISGDVAHAESYLLWGLQKKDMSKNLSGTARYIDRLERRDGVWKIALRRPTIDMRFEFDVQKTHPFQYEGVWNRTDPSYQRPLALPPDVQAKLQGPGPAAEPKRAEPDSDPARELRLLLDHRFIEDCIARACRGLDRFDRDILDSAFHKDAVMSNPFFTGYYPTWADQVFPSLAARSIEFSHHITSRTVHRIDGNVAECESYVIAVTQKDDIKTVTFDCARYADRLERRNGIWKIALRRVIPEARFLGVGSQQATDALWHYDKGHRNRDDISYERPLGLSAQNAKNLAARRKAGLPWNPEVEAEAVKTLAASMGRKF